MDTANWTAADWDNAARAAFEVNGMDGVRSIRAAQDVEIIAAALGGGGERAESPVQQPAGGSSALRVGKDLYSPMDVAIAELKARAGPVTPEKIAASHSKSSADIAAELAAFDRWTSKEIMYG